MGLAKKIGENVFWRGLYLASLFLINLLMARILGAGESGQFFLLINNLALIILVISFCLEAAIVFYGASGRIAFNKLAGIALLWSLPAPIIIAVFFWFGWPPQTNSPEILFIMVYVFSFLLINNFSGLFHAHQNFSTGNQVLTLVNIFYITYILVTSNFSFDKNVDQIGNSLAVQERIKWGYFITVFIQGIILVIVSRTRLSLKKWELPSVAEMQLLLRYAGQSLIANIVFFLVNRSGYWFVDYYCNDQLLGNYIQVSRLGQIFILPAVLIAGSLFPQTAGKKINFQSNSFSFLWRSLIIIYVSAMLLSVLIGKPVITFLWGEGYDEMYGTWLFYVPGVLFLAISYLFSPLFAGKGQVMYNILIGVFALIIVALASFIFVPLWGIRGAAIGSSVGFMSMMIFYIIIAKRKFGFRFISKPIG